MTIKEFLEWVAANGYAAFWLGVFVLVLLAGLSDWTVRLIRSFTGNYPPPDPPQAGEKPEE